MAAACVHGGSVIDGERVGSGVGAYVKITRDVLFKLKL